MYTIGYIDDDNDLISDYIKRLKGRDIDLKVAQRVQWQKLSNG